MKLRLLCSVVLAGLLLLPASAATRKAPAPPVAKKPAIRSQGVPAAAVKNSAAPTRPVKAEPPPATAAKPVAAARKSLSLKSLFSRKTVPKPAPAPAPKPVPVIAKKSPSTKAKTVIRPDPGEFLDISFPMPKIKKAAVASAGVPRR